MRVMPSTLAVDLLRAFQDEDRRTKIEAFYGHTFKELCLMAANAMENNSLYIIITAPSKEYLADKEVAYQQITRMMSRIEELEYIVRQKDSDLTAAQREIIALRKSFSAN